MTNINDIISSLAAAKEAQDLVPVLRSEVLESQDRLETVSHAYDIERERRAMLEAEVAELRSKLAAEVEAHKATTFREAESREKLEAFRSLVTGALGTVNEAVIVLKSEVGSTLNGLKEAEAELNIEPESEIQPVFLGYFEPKPMEAREWDVVPMPVPSVLPEPALYHRPEPEPEPFGSMTEAEARNGQDRPW